MAGRVDQVENVLLARLGRVVQAHRMRLDRDAALTLQIHGVEDLRLHFARLERAGELEEPVCQRRLAVVDVRDDREIPDEGGVHQNWCCRVPAASAVRSISCSASTAYHEGTKNHEDHEMILYKCASSSCRRFVPS